MSELPQPNRIEETTFKISSKPPEGYTASPSQYITMEEITVSELIDSARDMAKRKEKSLPDVVINNIKKYSADYRYFECIDNPTKRCDTKTLGGDSIVRVYAIKKNENGPIYKMITTRIPFGFSSFESDEQKSENIIITDETVDEIPDSFFSKNKLRSKIAVKVLHEVSTGGRKTRVRKSKKTRKTRKHRRR